MGFATKLAVRPQAVVGSVTAMDQTSTVFQPGDLVGGTFQVVSPVARDPLCASFLAVADGIPGRFVVRAIRTGPATPDQAVTLLAALESVATVTHPALPAVISTGYDDGVAWVVTEDPGGMTLRSWLTEGDGLNRAEVGRIVVSLASALAVLHRRPSPMAHGLVCLDSVIHLHAEGDLRLEGAGIAHALGAARLLPDLRTVHRAPGYLAPDVVGSVSRPPPLSPQGRAFPPRPTPAGDTFSLASVAFECLTGVPAFQGPDRAGTLVALCNGPRPSVHELRPDLPATLDGVFARAWSRSPAVAFRSVVDFAVEFARIIAASARPASRSSAPPLGIPPAAAVPVIPSYVLPPPSPAPPTPGPYADTPIPTGSLPPPRPSPPPFRGQAAPFGLPRPATMPPPPPPAAFDRRLSSTPPPASRARVSVSSVPPSVALGPLSPTTLSSTARRSTPPPVPSAVLRGPSLAPSGPPPSTLALSPVPPPSPLATVPAASIPRSADAFLARVGTTLEPTPPPAQPPSAPFPAVAVASILGAAMVLAAALDVAGRLAAATAAVPPGPVPAVAAPAVAAPPVAAPVCPPPPVCHPPAPSSAVPAEPSDEALTRLHTAQDAAIARCTQGRFASRHLNYDDRYEGPTGRCTLVRLEGSLLGSPEGACIAIAFRGIPVAPFSRPAWHDERSVIVPYLATPAAPTGNQGMSTVMVRRP